MPPIAPAIDSVTVAICTFRRPSLREALRSLQGQAPAHVRLRIVVVDNDDEPSAQKLAEACRTEFDLPVEYRHAPGRNISIARNVCLEMAGQGWLAFLDDDETATRGWLAKLLERAGNGEAAVVFAPVRAVYGADCPAWIRDGDFHSISVTYVGGKIITGYTSNVLINLDHPSVRGRRFQLDLGRSGGEDTKFFSDIHRAGGLLDFVPEAFVEEIAVPERNSFRWLFRRRFRYGQTHGRLLAAADTPAARWLAFGIAASKVLYCLADSGLHLRSAVGWRKSFLRGALHLGAMSRLLGMRELVLYGAVPAGSSVNAAGDGAPHATE
ncbi:MAG TPA: glycosyltransferase family 2 protein [Candidatus Sulfotelmatobacter sp.]|jgi:succinoglycan biosynthesis protein ExoM|nr:glycosyltransferase family 2 protein [Candidatus Sulfotelmatobacter sp.]